MKKTLIALFSLVMLAGCSFLAPYSITFTTPAHSAVDPLVDTLDLALGTSAMAYISEVDCEGSDPISLLPVVNEAMESSNVHNLTLELLDGFEATTECDVTVTAFDQSTTSTTAAEISLYVLEKPVEVPEHAEQINACKDAGGAWNECGSACEEGNEFCVQVCVPQCEFPEETGEELTEEIVEVTEDTVNQDACVDEGGQWHKTCDDDGLCEEWCEDLTTNETENTNDE